MNKKRFIRTISAVSLATLLGVGLTACSNNSEKSDQSQSSKQSTNIKQKANQAKDRIKTEQIKVDQNEAINKFHDKFNDKKIKEIDLVNKNNQYVYEIEGFDATHEYKMTINATNGKIINSHSEKLELDEHIQKAFNFDKIINRSEATKIAENEVKNSTAKEWKLDSDNGKVVWEVEVTNGTKDYNVTIDAETKKVISVDQ